MSQTGQSKLQLAAQVLTLVVVAGFGLVGILMFTDGRLGFILARPFHVPVLLGGIGLLALVALRTMSLRRAFHECDLAWQSSRLIILAFPLGVFLIGQPNSGFSQERIRRMLGADDAMTIAAVDPRRSEGTVSSFRELGAAIDDERLRESLTGCTAVLEGRIRRIDARQFTLFQLKMTCCAADATPVKVRIVLKSGTLNGLEDFDWVRMTGRLQFVETPNSERMTPVIVVEDSGSIRKTTAGSEYDE